MTPELVTIASTPQPAVDSGVRDQSRVVFMNAKLKAYMLPGLYWHGMLRGRA